MIAIAVTTAALVVILSAMNGLTGTVAELYNAFEPDIKIGVNKGKNFTFTNDQITKIKGINGVKAVSCALSDKALIKNSEQQVLVTIKGVDPEFVKVTAIEKSLIDGNYSLHSSKKNEILLGNGIANQLQINIKEYVSDLSILSPRRGKAESLNPEENINQVYVSPGAIFSLNDEFDYQYAFVSLETARKLFDEPEKISSVEVLCEEGSTDDVQENIKEMLGSAYTVKNRFELNDVLFKTLETEKLATFLILAFIMIIATFNIIGALTMLIIEKRKDIKTLYSLGAGLPLIRNIFMREGFLITGIGTAIGLLLGLFVCWLQIEFHLVKFGDEFVIPYYPIEIQFKDFIWIFSLIMLIGFFAALYPVRVFTRKDLVH